MELVHLSLENFRNYGNLEIDLPANVGLLVGENGQGKSNILEAIYYLATTRSHRASNDRELINWVAETQPLPHARLVGKVHRSSGNLQIEITLLGKPEKPSDEQTTEDDTTGVQFSLFQPATSSLKKVIKINGVSKRAIDAIGQVNVVMFGPQDLDLVSGAPALRRRYLDATLCQTNRHYARTLQRYNRVVLQRNHLLRQIAEGRSTPDELGYWDDSLVSLGAEILCARRESVALLSTMARDISEHLTLGHEHLRIVYRSTIADDGDVVAAFHEALAHYRRRETEAGMSLVGPHRDDLSFLVDGVDMRVYGSRGQQRTVALALKFAEARYMCGIVGEEPILLLDDIMSELDAKRRQWVLESIEGGGQVIITATDTDEYTADFLERATTMQVRDRNVRVVANRRTKR